MKDVAAVRRKSQSSKNLVILNRQSSIKSKDSVNNGGSGITPNVIQFKPSLEGNALTTLEDETRVQSAWKKTQKFCGCVRSHRMLIHERGKLRTTWDIMIIIFSIWISFAQPFEIAFNPPSMKGGSFTTFNYLIDIIFIIDIALNFRTTIYDFITGQEIAETSKIARKYLLGNFFFDLLAAIPFEFMSQQISQSHILEILGLISILKFFRVLRFTKVIRFLNTTEDVKLSLRLFKLIFYLIIYIHIQACAWFFYTKQDRQWFPVPDLIMDIRTFYDHGITYTYCLSVYHSVSILDGGEMVPANAH